MEFEHVGRLCQVDLCNQKDFLPFICDSCGMSLCLAHRSYTMHHCAGAKGKDMTSIDCPVCGKSVKFDKSQDPNVVWDDHYVNHCSQQQPSVQQKQIVRCFRPGCSTILGPSNTFTCTKCHQKVCMSHRMSEAHNCVGPVRKSFLDRVQNNASGDNHRSSTNGAGMFLQPAFKKKTATTKAAGKKKTGQKEGDPANTLKGTADLRRQRWEQQQQQQPPPPSPPAPPAAAASSNGPPTTEICPFCQQSMEGGDALMAHILATHPEDSGGSSNSSSSSSSSSRDHATVATASMHTSGSGSGSSYHESTAGINGTSSSSSSSSNSSSFREVCPICQQRFPDAIALVTHFEASHPGQQQQQQQGSGGSGASNRDGCWLC